MELLKYKELVAKYYEGLTSVDEELQLKSYLEKFEGDDAELNEAKLFFGILSDDARESVDIDFNAIVKSNSKVKRMYAMVSAVAASLIIGISLTFLLYKNAQPIVYAYVNGQPITNKQEAINYSQQALLSIQSNLNKGTKGLDYIDKLNKPVELLTVKK